MLRVVSVKKNMLTFATALKILLLIVCFALEWLERKRMFPVAPIFFEELNAYLLFLTVNQNPVYRLHELNEPPFFWDSKC